MEKVNILEPIRKKIEEWVNYEKNKPKEDYWENKEMHDNYRRENDLDCKLAGGNLLADTLISLWLPLRFTLVNLNKSSTLRKVGDLYNKDDDKTVFLNSFINHNLEEFLPINNPTVIRLSELFKLGWERENVVILKNREINSLKGKEPYFDYMPHFLFECFKDGAFSGYFDKDDNKLSEWIEEKKLQMFFKNVEVNKSKIRDLAGSGSIKNNIPKDINALNTMLDNYIDILKVRGELINSNLEL